MSSWTFETYEKGNKFVEYRWEKGGMYSMFYGHIVNCVVKTIYKGTYATKEGAKRAFKRQVKQLEKEIL